jgi:PAS domain S-box-containing protein
MDYEKLSREELLRRLRELTDQQAPSARPGPDAESLLHELQVHQIELEMQNRELREAHSALEESRNGYADLYDFAPLAYCTIDRHGLVEALNLTAASLFGREREQAVGHPLTSLVRFDDPRSFWRHLAACATNTEAVISEFRLFVRGQVVQVEAVSVPVWVLSGSPRAFRTAFTNITRRKQAESERELAHASEQRLRALMEVLDRAHVEAALALAKPGRAGLEELMTVIVRHARRVTGAHTAHLELTQHAGQFGPLRTAFADEHIQAARTETVHVLGAQLRYGERALAELQVGRFDAGDPFPEDARRALDMLAERLGSSLEIARLQTLEARENLRLSLLEQIEQKLRDALSVEAARSSVGRVGEAIVPAIADLCVVHLVQGRKLVLQQLTHVEAKQQQALAAKLNEDATAQALSNSLTQLAQSRAPQLVRLDSGESSTPESYAELTAALQLSSLIIAPLWARDQLLGTICFGRLDTDSCYDLGLLGWVHEIARRCSSALDAAQLTHELREALRWRENLMAMISHDLKSPLSAISLSARSMTPDRPLTERRSSRKQVDLIQRSAAHMNHLINDLLSASLLEAGAFRVAPRRESALALATEACQLAEPLLNARSLRLERAFAADLPFVRADREPIQRVFANLFGNAAKFTPKGGCIRLSASYGADRVKFCISDTGPGIPVEQQGRLFDRYWKGRVGGKGVGLGLYISKAIVEAHEGRIWIERSSEAGATFCFELCRCDAAH